MQQINHLILEQNIVSKWTFTDCITEINNTQIDNAKYIVVMLVYNLIEYSDNCSRTTGGLWQYHKDEPKNPMTDSNSFKFKHALSGVRQFLVTESPLQMMKNAPKKLKISKSVTAQSWKKQFQYS